MASVDPLLLRDFRQGRFVPTSVSEYLIPQNSVSWCRNMNFDTIIGKAVVRPGTTLIGTLASTVGASRTPQGFAQFVGTGGSPNYLLAVYNGASNATAYYWNGSTWAATNKTSLTNSKKTRFATLGGSVFMCNSSDGMFDASDGHTFGTTNSISSGSAKPNLIYRYTATMMCSGDPTYPSRVFFSSVVAPGNSPIITWTPSTNYIDINPDDGGYVTAFAETSTFLLIFKSNGMYRIDAVSKSVDPNNIYNIGAVGQEAVVACQGVVYFFSGTDIRSTNGDFPQQISRLGVQDIIDAIPQSSWSSVAAGADDWNVYFSVGNVTLNSNKTNQVTLTNCILKFSTRDQSWSVHTYATPFQFFSQYTDSNGRMLRALDTSSNCQTINLGTTDNGTPIYYEMETQDLEFGNRAHLKQMSDQIVFFMQNGMGCGMTVLLDDERKPVPVNLSDRVSFAKDVDLLAHYFRFRWFGESILTVPVIEGLYVEKISDLGFSKG